MQVALSIVHDSRFLALCCQGSQRLRFDALETKRREGAFNTVEFMKTLPGVSQPMGYFDPLGTPTSWNPPFITGERDIIS